MFLSHAPGRWLASSRAWRLYGVAVAAFVMLGCAPATRAPPSPTTTESKGGPTPIEAAEPSGPVAVGAPPFVEPANVASAAESRPPPSPSPPSPSPPSPSPLVLRMDDCPARLEVLDFEHESAKLAARHAPVVREMAKILQENPSLHVLGIEGFADGRERSPGGLSARRARALRDALVRAGIAPERLEIRGTGTGTPRSTPPTAKCAKPNNRVVEVVVLARADGQPPGHFTTDAPKSR